MTSRRKINHGDTEAQRRASGDSAGRPCVGAHGAAGEIIVDGDTGWLVAADDRAQLRDAVVRLLCDRGAADTMGARGRVRFLQQFTEERFRDRFTALLPLAAPALTA